MARLLLRSVNINVFDSAERTEPGQTVMFRGDGAPAMRAVVVVPGRQLAHELEKRHVEAWLSDRTRVAEKM